MLKLKEVEARGNVSPSTLGSRAGQEMDSQSGISLGLVADRQKIPDCCCCRDFEVVSMAKFSRLKLCFMSLYM